MIASLFRHEEHKEHEADEDVLDLAEPILKHRMALTFAARAEGETIEAVIGRIKARIG